MRIRTFTINDQNAVIKLWEACNLVVPWNDPAKDIQRKMKVDPDLFLVGERNHTIIGTVMGGYEGHRGWINYLAVSPEHRRKGYARLLMGSVEELLEKKGCPKINLQVREGNVQVLDFYQSIGFQRDNVIGLGKRIQSDTKE